MKKKLVIAKNKTSKLISLKMTLVKNLKVMTNHLRMNKKTLPISTHSSLTS